MLSRSAKFSTRLFTKPLIGGSMVRSMSAHKTEFFAPTSSETEGVFFRYISRPRTVSVIGVPLALGQNLDGVDTGPTVLREGGLFERIKEEKWTVEDTGDIDVPKVPLLAGDPKLHCAAEISQVNKATAERAYEHAKDNKFVLSIGGDHSIAIGSIAGLLKARPDMGVIWVDAHADINTPETTLSGHIHGMCVSFLMKHPESVNVPEYAWMHDYPALDPRRIVYVGLRDLDAGEKKIIRKYGIKAFTMKEIDRWGIGAVMEQAVEHLRAREDRPIHLTFDIDGIDPTFAPSTGTRVGGGLSYREAYYVCESLADTGLLASMDLVEVNALLQPEDSGRTIKLANGLVATALGNSLL